MAIGLNLDVQNLSLIVGAVAPVLGILGGLFLERRRRRARGVKPPQQEKLLRPPGYSLSIRLDDLWDKTLNRSFAAVIISVVAGGLVSIVSPAFVLDIPIAWRLFFISLPILAGLLGAIVAVWTYRTVLKAWNVRLGLRGEQATAEALHELSDTGFRAFHDIQGGEDWNIDHVLVGTKGVYVIETKARCRCGAGRGLLEHQVRLDGDVLIFPSGTNRTATRQAERNAQWLSDVLSKRTAEPVRVEPIVVLPGWYVVDGDKGSVPAMTCNYLTGYLRRQSDKISPAQVKRIVAYLDEKNRTLEFN